MQKEILILRRETEYPVTVDHRLLAVDGETIGAAGGRQIHVSRVGLLAHAGSFDASRLPLNIPIDFRHARKSSTRSVAVRPRSIFQIAHGTARSARAGPSWSAIVILIRTDDRTLWQERSHKSSYWRKCIR